MQNYTDSRTMFIKEMLRFQLFQTHFYDQPLEKIDEEVITDITYLMEEQYFPSEDVLFNKGDEIDGVYFVMDGEVQMILSSSHS